MGFFEVLNQYSIYMVIGLFILVIILLIMLIINMSKVSKMQNTLAEFMSGKDAQSLEQIVLTLVKDVKSVKVENRKMAQVFGTMNENLKACYRKIGIVKYDAFRGLSGKLSFSLCLLDEYNSGYILNVMHGNGGCYTYMKEIIRGEAMVPLSNEEKKALESALTNEKGD